MSVYTERAPEGLEKEHSQIFTEETQAFIAELYVEFSGEIRELYQRRVYRKLELDRTNSTPTFLEETKAIRDDPDWRVAPVPDRVKCRKIDCGDVSPCNFKPFKQALNSQANGIQVDFDDGHCPSWKNQITGYANILNFTNGNIPGTPELARAPVLMIRPRAWNMTERNVMVGGERVPGPIVDFTVIMYHVSRRLFDHKSGPFLYLSKLEGYLEARLWKEIFIWTESKLKLPYGTVKACVLIENVLAAFEMEEILFELKDHSLGLNCGIWDYCASFINKFGSRPEFCLPDRSKYVNMQKNFLKSYCEKVVGVCHKRGALATGGMNAKVLPLDDPQQREEITQQVCSSKRMEVELGVDGFLIYDLTLIPAALDMINAIIPGDNQSDKIPAATSSITAADLLTFPNGTVTRDGLRLNVAVGILFISSWLQGDGVFVYNGSVEDSATAEISRSQVWQWVRHEVRLEDDGKLIDKKLVSTTVSDVMSNLVIQGTASDVLHTAAEMFLEIVCKREFPEFITTYLGEDHTWLSHTS